MGDRTDVYIKFGGRISRRAAEALVEALEREGYRCNDGTDNKPTIADLDEDFYAYEVNYANIDGLDAVCRRFGIDYDMNHGAGGGYGPCCQRYMGGEHRECSADADSGPMVPLSQILDTETLATGLGDLIKLARFMCGDFPNLVIDDTIVDTVDLSPAAASIIE